MKSFILMVITMVCAISLEAQNKSFYDFNVTTIDGKEFPLSSLKGKKVLVDRKSTRLNSSHNRESRMPSSA